MWRKSAPPAEIFLGELRIKAPERSDALWVVDGRQRLTTLIGALTAPEDTVDRRFGMVFGALHSAPSMPSRPTFHSCAADPC